MTNSSILKVKNNIQKHLSLFLYRYYKALQPGYGLNTDEKRDPKIIVSLTSFGPRLSEVDVCIRSLLSQTKKPDAVLLYLDRNTSGNEVPEKLIRLEQYGLRIIYGCEDLKPHKKYFFAMQSYPDDIVITVDDDVIYEKTLVEDLYRMHMKYPGCVICGRARQICLNPDGQLLPYQQWNVEKKHFGIPSAKLLPVGVGGVLYPPGVLSGKVFDKRSFADLCLYADDLWLKGAELQNGVKAVCVKPKFPCLMHLPIQDNVELQTENRLGGRNDMYIKNVISFYSLVADHLV